MRSLLLLATGAAAATIAAATGAAAQERRTEICRKGEDARRIEVVAPGTVGAACDVVYRRGDGDVSVPYNANVDSAFCRARAAELAATLIADGFVCESDEASVVEAALDGAPQKTAGAQVPPAQTPPDTAPGAALDAPLDTQVDAIRQAESAAPAATIVASTGDTPNRLETPERTAATPAADAPPPPASAAPVQLASDPRPSEFKAPRPPRAKGPGRIVGPQPTIEDIIDVSTTTPTAVDAVPEVAAAKPSGRPAEAIIRGVIAANAAAWNEGNIDAFMAGYSNSADLLLIRGATVTSGWQQARKQVEQEIAAQGSMGRLSFEALDVKMTSDDVATVVGRYEFIDSAAPSGGVTTLVLKQVEGRWRIVQDTRIADLRP